MKCDPGCKERRRKVNGRENREEERGEGMTEVEKKRRKEIVW